MNDSWTVETLRPTILPELTEIWMTSGRYNSFEDANAWAQQCFARGDALAVRVKKHSWSCETVFELKR